MCSMVICVCVCECYFKRGNLKACCSMSSRFANQLAIVSRNYFHRENRTTKIEQQHLVGWIFSEFTAIYTLSVRQLRI